MLFLWPNIGFPHELLRNEGTVIFSDIVSIHFDCAMRDIAAEL